MADTPATTAAETAADTEAQTQAAAGVAPAAAERSAADAAANAAQAAEPRLSDADAERIGRAAAKSTIEELERRGVFEEPEPSAPAAETPPPAPEPNNATDTPPGTDDAPVKKSFAQRYLGL